jgi:lipopolysaccharide/colanic/teichoic acid biosynthesis glycosyltransferase
MESSVSRIASLRFLWRARPVADNRPAEGAPRLVVRRTLNVTVAAIGIVLTLPLMVLIAVAIWLTSRGPVIYRQARIGLDRRARGQPHGNSRRYVDYGGKPFTIYKFRTMRVERSSDEVWASPGDSRVTPIGRWLRRLRLDELPQLFNVLFGDMNVVGPRPEQPTIALNLLELVEGYRARHRVLPGITGLAQTRLDYDRSLDDVRKKVALDLEYISRESTFEDLKIMLQTFPVMLGARRGW